MARFKTSDTNERRRVLAPFGPFWHFLAPFVTHPAGTRERAMPWWNRAAGKDGDRLAASMSGFVAFCGVLSRFVVDFHGARERHRQGGLQVEGCGLKVAGYKLKGLKTLPFLYHFGANFRFGRW